MRYNMEGICWCVSRLMPRQPTLREISNLVEVITHPQLVFQTEKNVNFSHFKNKSIEPFHGPFWPINWKMDGRDRNVPRTLSSVWSQEVVHERAQSSNLRRSPMTLLSPVFSDLVRWPCSSLLVPTLFVTAALGLSHPFAMLFFARPASHRQRCSRNVVRLPCFSSLGPSLMWTWVLSWCLWCLLVRGRALRFFLLDHHSLLCFESLRCLSREERFRLSLVFISLFHVFWVDCEEVGGMMSVRDGTRQRSCSITGACGAVSEQTWTILRPTFPWNSSLGFWRSLDRRSRYSTGVAKELSLWSCVLSSADSDENYPELWSNERWSNRLEMSLDQSR